MKRTPLKRTPFRRKPLKRERMDEELRMRVLRRDGWRCQLTVAHDCRGDLHVHHRRLRSQGGPDTMENLVSLCPVAHDWVHGHRAEAEELGMILRSAPGR